MQKLSRLLSIFFMLAVVTVIGQPVASAQSAGAVRAVDGFYSWYMSTHGNWTDNLGGARPYMTPSLYSLLQKMVTIERREQAAVLDFDPFNGAQAEAASYTLGSATASGSTATVPVHIRLSGGNGASTVKVVAVHGSSGWKIDNILYPSGPDLRHALQTALK